MSDEDEQKPYVWESLVPLQEGQEPQTAAWVKAPGRARVTYPNGDTFDGTFNEASLKHGQGVYVWATEEGANPWVPEGGLPEGRVVKYEGSWVNGVRAGVGKISYPNGDRYHGLWENNKPNGEGTYFYSNGDLYSGNWVNGVRSGEGAFVFAIDDSQLVGTWVNGEITKGKWLFADSTTWHGSFKKNKPIGPGVFYFPNGLQQDGTYVEEGDPEDDEAEIKLTWRGGAMVPSSQSAADLARVPLVL